MHKCDIASCMYTSRLPSCFHRPAYFKTEIVAPCMNWCVAPPGRKHPGVRGMRHQPSWSRICRKTLLKRACLPGHKGMSGGQPTTYQRIQATSAGSRHMQNWKRPRLLLFLGSRKRTTMMSGSKEERGRRRSAITSFINSAGRSKQWWPSLQRIAKLKYICMSLSVDDPSASAIAYKKNPVSITAGSGMRDRRGRCSCQLFMQSQGRPSLPLSGR